MGILKPVLMLAILSSLMLCNNAWTTDPPPRVGATPDAATSQAKPPPQKKKPPPRRAVRAAPPVVYGPRLNPGPVERAIPMPTPMPSPAPSSQILNGCAGGICTDNAGGQYHGGVGTTLISPQGRLCSNNGITVQCF